MRNPYLRAFLASGYIACVVGAIWLLSETATHGEDTMVIPLAMLSLLVLSVATMAYLFFYEPLRLHLKGEEQEAVSQFLKTLVTFAAITAFVFMAVLAVGRVFVS